MSLEILKYIADSPPAEHGGFHENTIAAAKWALAEIARISTNYAKLHGCVQAYIQADPQIRGEAYRDLAGTMEHLAGRDDALGWPALCRRLDEKITQLQAIIDAKLHLRRCHDCGHEFYAADSKRPYCLCDKCRSQDTRLVKAR